MQKICVIEDSFTVQKLIEFQLRDTFSLIFASSVAQANEVLKKDSVDLIVLDIDLPDGNGFELFSKLRADTRYARVPILFLTGKTSDFEKRLGKSIGADDYLVKPVQAEELRRRISDRLRLGAGRPSQSAVDTIGGFVFDVMKHSVTIGTDVKPKEVHLTHFEFKLLYFLASQRGQMFSRAELVAKLEPASSGMEDIHVAFLSLKRKLGAAAIVLEAIPQAGYRFVEID